MTMRIAVLGTDYDGLIISVGMARMGHSVTAVDYHPGRARQLQRGPAVENDVELSREIKKVLREGLLKFTAEPEGCLAEADVVIIADLPESDSGDPVNRTTILRTAECLTGAMGSFKAVLVSARVPEGSCRLLQDWIDDSMFSGAVSVVAYPVFFSQPDGLQEFLRPERIVLGYENDRSRRLLDDLFSGFLMEEASICHVSWEAAEMMRTAGGILAVGIPIIEKTVTRPEYARIAVGS